MLGGPSRGTIEPMRVPAITRPAAAARLRFPRAANDRLLAGVAGGLAARLRADSYVVRLSFVLLTLAGGVGVLAYALAWALSDPPQVDSDPAPARPERSAAVGLLTLAALIVLRALRLWPGDWIMVSAVVVATGSALVWHGERGAAAADPFERLFTGKSSLPRVAGGLVLMLAGLIALTANGELSAVPRSAAALALAVAGLTVILGPFLGSLVRDLRTAERERIRTEERAEMAAQLHDSVLQTLALMQRSADDPRRMVLLARRQERELRYWLYGGANTPAPARTLSDHAEALAAEIELDHDLPVDLVVVGDHAMDDAASALLGAVREAAVNVAKHSGADSVAIYVEVNDTSLVAFVRDKGRGFDPTSTPADRHGIDASIRARLARVGGRSRLETSPGAGAEWELEVPA
jgi:signal transduction histidine kinase